MTARRTKGRRTAWRKFQMDPATVADLLSDYPMCEGNPLKAVGHVDADLRPRRLAAEYANGWSIQLNIDAKGRVTSYQQTFSWRGRVKK